MLLVPLRPLPAQQIATLLELQPVTIQVAQKSTGLFLTLKNNAVPVVTGVLCLNLNRLVRARYLPFQGDLFFFDTQGEADPSYDELGSRFLLYYLTAAELG